MAIRVQEITKTNKEDYKDLMPEEICSMIGTFSIFSYALLFENKPHTIATVEIRKASAIIFFIRVIPSNYPDEAILQAMLQALERIMREKKIDRLVSFHPDSSLMEQVVQRMKWKSVEHQYDYQLKLKNFSKQNSVEVGSYHVVPCRTRSSNFFETAFKKVQKEAEENQISLPPRPAINVDASYLLLEGSEPIGWLMATASKDGTIGIARFYVGEHSRGLLIPYRFLLIACSDMQHNLQVKQVSFHIKMCKLKLINLIDKSLLGEVLQKRRIQLAQKVL
ncbi:hypothetical protein [Halalkalibacter oceani]|uniref:hypothetical protein n=1 Tax=Halalkalibacter oceani TaxID=1653776 RepID=UPI003398200A